MYLNIFFSLKPHVQSFIPSSLFKSPFFWYSQQFPHAPDWLHVMMSVSPAQLSCQSLSWSLIRVWRPRAPRVTGCWPWCCWSRPWCWPRAGLTSTGTRMVTDSGAGVTLWLNSDNSVCQGPCGWLWWWQWRYNGHWGWWWRRGWYQR